MLKIVPGIENTCTVYRDCNPPAGVDFIEIDEDLPDDGSRIYYDAATGTVYIEPEPAPTPPTELQLLGQQITDEQLARIELGQANTDLELAMLGGIANV